MSTLRDLAEEFLAFHSIYGDAKGTVRWNLEILKRHLGALELTAIGEAEIEGFIAARLKEGVQRSTINRQRATLSKMFNWAIRRRYHPGPNPVAAVRRFRESPGRTRYLTTQEADRLILAAAAHLKPLLWAALHTGGRLGELLALRWGDVELERRFIRFRKETTKSRRERVVPITRELDVELRRLGPGTPDDLVFRWKGRPIRGVRTAFHTARRKAGLGSDVVFHSLRHTFASHAAMHGLDLRRLQRYLGHSTAALTERYSHLSEDYLSDGVQFLGHRQPAAGRRSEDEES